MDIQTEKLALLQTIINTEDISLILDMKNTLTNREIDWFSNLNQEQQNDIDEGIAQADRGEIIPHNEVVNLFGKWGLK
ncbi:MAG: hypothetical protein EOP42_08565 [Sphingobacteriaceae bacterium]|nr:MAG: hypothetical protein EOP42_08565 [Sphingobacteriaceae bacterium]